MRASYMRSETPIIYTIPSRLEKKKKLSRMRMHKKSPEARSVPKIRGN